MRWQPRNEVEVSLLGVCNDRRQGVWGQYDVSIDETQPLAFGTLRELSACVRPPSKTSINPSARKHFDAIVSLGSLQRDPLSFIGRRIVEHQYLNTIARLRRSASQGPAKNAGFVSRRY